VNAEANRLNDAVDRAYATKAATGWVGFPAWSYRRLEICNLRPVQPRSRRWLVGARAQSTRTSVWTGKVFPRPALC